MRNPFFSRKEVRIHPERHNVSLCSKRHFEGARDREIRSFPRKEVRIHPERAQCLASLEMTRWAAAPPYDAQPPGKSNDP